MCLDSGQSVVHPPVAADYIRLVTEIVRPSRKQVKLPIIALAYWFVGNATQTQAPKCYTGTAVSDAILRTLPYKSITISRSLNVLIFTFRALVGYGSSRQPPMRSENLSLTT